MEKKELSEKIKSWINKEGYPFEMTVARIFRKHNLQVYESSYYLDSETGKYREIDLLVYYVRHLSGNRVFNVKFIIECKYAPQPWLLFDSPDGAYKNLTIDYLIKGNTSGQEFLRQFGSYDKTSTEGNLFIYDSNIGYGLIETMKNKNEGRIDLAYKSVDAAFKVVEHEIDKNKENHHVCELYIPIVVIKGKLFKCSQDDKEETHVNEINHANLLWKKKLDTLGFGFINIVTIDHLDDLIHKLIKDIKYIEKEHLDKVNIALNKSKPRKKGISIRN